MRHLIEFRDCLQALLEAFPKAFSANEDVMAYKLQLMILVSVIQTLFHGSHSLNDLSRLDIYQQ